jgi:crossover junction endodeoxyribonuclease RuvC
MTAWIGIDPGKTGALAIVCDSGASADDLPYIGSEVDVRAIADIFEGLTDAIVALEYQAPFSAPGRLMGATSAFALGEGYGMLKGFCLSAGFRVLLPRPAAWKKHFGLTGKDKEASRQLANQLFPSVDLHLKKHHGRAEALLLAEWARRQP